MVKHLSLRLSLVLSICLVPFTSISVLSIPAKTSAERYVSTSGSNVGDCTSISCKTIQYAVNVSNPNDTIHVAAGTYTEAGIKVDRNITLMGAGADTTIIQAAATPSEASDRVFDITHGNDVVMKDLTIQNGFVAGIGAGILVTGSSLTLQNVWVHKNTAATAGTNEGGGIKVRDGWLSLDSCAISSNYARDAGGGIHLYYSSADIVNTTFYSNRTDGKGGAIGTLSDTLETIDIAYTTIANNVVDDFGGGMQVESNFTVNLSNVIVAHNYAANGRDIYGEVNSQDYNFIGTTSGATITGSVEHNIYDQDAGLGAFQFNGGPTKTRALSPSSPAVDAGNCFALSKDQRGYPRPANIPGVDNVADGCDIGAYEVELKVGLPLVFRSD